MSDTPPSRLWRWTEAVGLVAVVVSLVFVGLQIRQSTAIARAEAHQSFLSEINQLSLASLDPVLLNVAARLWMQNVPYEELSNVEQVALLSQHSGFIRTYEAIYLQVQTGVLDETAFALIEGYMTDHPHVLFAWAVARRFVTPDFRTFAEARHPFLRQQP